MNDVIKHLTKAADAMYKAWCWLPVEERAAAEVGRNEILLAIGEYIIEYTAHDEYIDALKSELRKVKTELKKAQDND